MTLIQVELLIVAVTVCAAVIADDYRRHQRIIQHERQQQFARALDRAIADRNEGVK